MTAVPRRVQRRREAGWRKPADCVIVDRTSRFGNPFTVAQALEADMAETVDEARAYVTETFRAWLEGEAPDGPDGSSWSRERRERILAGLPLLRGKSLACFCPLPVPGEPDHCHGAVLLRLAAVGGELLEAGR